MPSNDMEQTPALCCLVSAALWTGYWLELGPPNLLCVSAQEVAVEADDCPAVPSAGSGLSWLPAALAERGYNMAKY